MRYINTKDLNDRREQNPEIHLINFITDPSREKDHIPGSISIPDTSLITNQFDKDEVPQAMMKKKPKTPIANWKRRVYQPLVFCGGVKTWASVNEEK